ncbi:MAG TPA: oligosaccharide repeat unit polymerase [Burkholderiaceae bacterium]|nr:oligosaccharide repeat unit polymerase [Burkholderiaceae bacterium]
MRRVTTHRYLWIPLLIYGVPNLLALAGAWWLDLLVVDLVPIPLTASASTFAAVLLALLFSLVFLTLCIVAGSGHFRAEPLVRTPPPIIGQLVFILKLITIGALIYSGYGRAGYRPDSADAFSIIASYTKSDLFFILYYGHVRAKRFPIINLALYVAGNTIRGWSGMWLILLLIEAYYVVARVDRGLPLKKLAAFALAGLLLFPFANTVRHVMRGSDAAPPTYVDSYFVLVNRLQHATNVMLIAQQARELTADYEASRIRPWILHGAALPIVKWFGSDGDALDTYITKNYLIETSDTDVDSFWYTNVGLAGWLFIVPWYEVPLYLAYIAVLIIAPYWLIGRHIGARSVLPVLHVASFVYVLHGWLEVQVTFLVCAAIYVAAVRLLRNSRPRASKPTPTVLANGVR